MPQQRAKKRTTNKTVKSREKKNAELKGIQAKSPAAAAAATASKEKLHEWHLTCQTGDGAGCRAPLVVVVAGDGTETEWKLLQLQF